MPNVWHEEGKRAPNATSGWLLHGIDVVVSEVTRSIYVVNLKAASSSIKGWMISHAAGVQNCRPEKEATLQRIASLPSLNASEAELQACCIWLDGRGRLSTRCLGPEHRDFFTFTFVRDPVAKWESGTRQAWIQGLVPYVRSFSADGHLEYALKHAHGKDQHLEPSSWRLSGGMRDGAPIRYDFIGRVETFERDWRRLLDLWPPLSRSHANDTCRSCARSTAPMPLQLNHRRAAAPPPPPRRKRPPPRPDAATKINAAPPDVLKGLLETFKAPPCARSLDRSVRCANALESQLGSHLSQTSICAMCSSWRFAADFVRFGYASSCPEECPPNESALLQGYPAMKGPAVVST